jgi:hypothetical protein
MTTDLRFPSRAPFGRWLAAGTVMAACVGLSGCGVVAVAGATAGAAISVAGAVVSTGVKVTGKVIEKTIDVVTPSSPAPAE